MGGGGGSGRGNDMREASIKECVDYLVKYNMLPNSEKQADTCLALSILTYCSASVIYILYKWVENLIRQSNVI